MTNSINEFKKIRNSALKRLFIIIIPILIAGFVIVIKYDNGNLFYLGWALVIFGTISNFINSHQFDKKVEDLKREKGK